MFVPQNICSVNSRCIMIFPIIPSPDFYSDISSKQEGFAGAHIRAVCASLGCGISKPEPDDDKIDFTISSKVRGTVLTKPKIDIQSKCKLASTHLLDNVTEFSYQVDKSLYDNHRDTQVSIPRLLVITLVPRECRDWINYAHESTRLSFCSYWLSLKGMAALPDEQESKVLRIPRANVFSAAFIHRSMQRISDGHEPFRIED